LYAAGDTLGLLSKRARAAIESADRLLVSPMVLLEIALLRETKRITAGSDEVFVALRESVGLDFDGQPFSEVAAEAARLSWPRDPFDRIIAAQAKVAGAPLLTRDRRIRRHLAAAFW
jgi:PIN domain nuclease of toxin-antitoxin system